MSVIVKKLTGNKSERYGMKFDKLKPNEIIEVQEFNDSGKKVKRKYKVKAVKKLRNGVITGLEELGNGNGN